MIPTARSHNQWNRCNRSITRCQNGPPTRLIRGVRFTLHTVNLTLVECRELEIPDIQCSRLSNITSRVRSRLDVDNDGDVDARDFALRLQAVSDLNVTAADCKKLELDAVDCSALDDLTVRAVTSVSRVVTSLSRRNVAFAVTSLSP